MKKGFWSLIAFKNFKPMMLWETYDGFYSEYDCGLSDYWTDLRFETKEIKRMYDNFWVNDSFEGYLFTVPFFIAYILVLKGTLREFFAERKYIRDCEKRHREMENA